MKLTKVSLCLATLALGVASAASSYTVTITSNTRAGQTELTPGEYKIQVEGSQAVFTKGKTNIPVPVTVEKNATKFRYTMLETENSQLQSIDLGGTNMKLVVAPAKS